MFEQAFHQQFTEFIPLQDATNHLAMTQAAERAYCQWYAGRQYAGKGQIVELGCWLGSLTNALARGLQANRRIPDAAKRIQVFDYFKWDVVMEDWVKGTPLQGRTPVGENYMTVFLEMIAKHRSMVTINEADLTTTRWTGENIEFLLVDAMKSYVLANNITCEFFPSILPGGYIFHQDYFHFFHGWIHFIMYRLRDYFKAIFEVPDSTTIIYKCVRKLPFRAIELPDSLKKITIDEVHKAFDWNCSLVSPSTCHYIDAARTNFFYHRGEHEECRRLYNQYTSGRYKNSSEFKSMYDFNTHFDLITY